MCPLPVVFPRYLITYPFSWHLRSHFCHYFYCLDIGKFREHNIYICVFLTVWYDFAYLCVLCCSPAILSFYLFFLHIFFLYFFLLICYHIGYSSFKLVSFRIIFPCSLSFCHLFLWTKDERKLISTLPFKTNNTLKEAEKDIFKRQHVRIRNW